MADKHTFKLIPTRRFPDFANDDEWQIKRIGDFAEAIAGATPSTTISEYWNGGTIPWMSSGEVHKGLIFSTEKKITELGYTNSSTKKVPANTVVIALAGQGKTRGTVGITKIELCTNQSLCSIIPNNNYDSDYLYHYLVSKYDMLRRISSGDGTRGGLNLQMVKDLLIPLPSLSEQHHIAASLSSLDEEISTTNRKIEQLKLQKKGLMQALFPPKNDKTPKLRFKEYKMNGEWKERKLGIIGESYSGLNGKDKNDFGHGEAEYITYMNVFSNPITKQEMNLATEVDNKQHSVKYGDILFTTSSETPEEVGMTSIWLENKKNVYLNSFCFGYRLNEKFKKDFNYIYLSYYFRSEFFREKIKVLAQGISRYNISKNKVMELPLLYPSLHEQSKIADCLFTIDDTIQHYSNKISFLKHHKKGLIQQLFPTIK